MTQLRNQYIQKLKELSDNLPEKKSECEILREEKYELIQMKMHFERELTAMKRDLAVYKRRVEHAEANEKIGRTKLQAAMEKCIKLG